MLHTHSSLSRCSLSSKYFIHGLWIFHPVLLVDWTLMGFSFTTCRLDGCMKADTPNLMRINPGISFSRFSQHLVSNHMDYPRNQVLNHRLMVTPLSTKLFFRRKTVSDNLHQLRRIIMEIFFPHTLLFSNEINKVDH